MRIEKVYGYRWVLPEAFDLDTPPVNISLLSLIYTLEVWKREGITEVRVEKLEAVNVKI